MRTTMTINDELYLRLKRQVLERGITVSAFLEDAIVGQLLEDSADMEDIEKRLQEPTISHEQLIQELKAEGLL